MTQSGDLVVVGRVGPPRGVRGDVFVEPRTDAPHERFISGAVLRTDPPERGPLTVESASDAGGKLVVHFVGVDGREAAQALRGVQLAVAATDRPPLDDPDEFYDTDLLGLTAFGVDGSELGPVTDVLHVGANSYLVLRIAGRDQLVPFVAAIVPTVDPGAGRVVVDPPEGLLEL
ncbi:MAG TPA: ribosome maturation factor RimM [Jatrophihabitans sp.]|nr:ribosome maturation factor RimM [Jatrophihabitans sp.]